MLKKLIYLFLYISLSSGFYSCSKPDDVINSSEKGWLQNNDTITVALFPYYAPYQFINESEKIDGILIDYLDFIEQKINYKFERRLYSNWTELIKDAKNHKVDIVLEIQQTQERDTYLNFYLQLFESNYSIVTRKEDTPDISGIEDYYGKVVTVPKDYGIHELLKEQEKDLIIATEIDDLTCLKKINSGSYDAYIGPKAVANYFIKTENLDQVIISSETNYNYAPGIGVQKENVILNQIIAKVTGSIGKKDKQVIFDNWLYLVVEPFYKKTNFWIVLTTAIFSILISIFLLNRYLKHLIKRRTRELFIAKGQAEESNRLKTAFIHNISHEVRTPMNGIIGFSELLKEDDLPKDKQQEYTKIVIDSSDQLVQIIDDIVEISRLQMNETQVQYRKATLNTELEKLISELQYRAKSKGISLTYTSPLTESQNRILIDTLKLRKIVSNLIDNAIKFTSEGSIEVSSRLKNGILLISVKDTGIGIKPRDYELIFRNFSQSEKEMTTSYDGLGLGLSIARKNARLLGGDIYFSSQVDKGSSFTLTLPYNPAIDADGDA